MFISKREKEDIQLRLLSLEMIVKSLTEAKLSEKPRQGWSEEAKRIQSEKAKARWAKKRAEKAVA